MTLPKVELLGEHMPWFGSGLPRGTHKIHVTEVIRELLIDQGNELFADNPTKEDEEEYRRMREKMSVGFLWEDVMSEVYAERMRFHANDPEHDTVNVCDVVRPDEIEYDGILMSPDAMETRYIGKVTIAGDIFGDIFDPEPDKEVILHEYKFTRLGIPIHKGEDEVIAKFLGDFPFNYWMMQAMAYCSGVGATICYHHVLHYNGAYRSPDYRIIAQVYKTTFTQEMLDENWDRIKRKAIVLEEVARVL
jgi:hypothetical protein